MPARTCDGPTCQPEGQLSCGEIVTSSTNAVGSTDAILTWDCTAQYTYAGPERVWTLTPTVSETVTLSATGLTADLDLFVSEGSCEGGCLASSIHAADSDETVSFAAQAGQTYTVVLDGYNGAVSAFSLMADCTPEFRLDIDPPSLGGSVELRITGAPPGATVVVGVSAGGPGSGPCPAALGGLCLDLVQPRPVRTVIADANGEASFTQFIPAATPWGTRTLQAGVVAGGAPAVTPPVVVQLP